MAIKQVRAAALALLGAALMGAILAAVKNDGSWTYSMPLGNISGEWCIPPLMMGWIFRERLLTAVASGIASCLVMMAGFYAEYAREGFVSSAIYSDIQRYFMLSIALGAAVSALSYFIGPRSYLRWIALGFIFIGEQFAWRFTRFFPFLNGLQVPTHSRHFAAWQTVFYAESALGVIVIAAAGFLRARKTVSNKTP